MDAGAYDAWFRTPRGAWIGDTEFGLLRQLLHPQPGWSRLDVGCGTGYFTRRFAAESSLRVVGLDPDNSALAYARTHGTGTERYCAGTAVSLPFGDRSFDLSVSVTALCFVDEAKRAIGEMLRVTRERLAIGLLNRYRLLYLQKGQRAAQVRTVVHIGTRHEKSVGSSTGCRLPIWPSEMQYSYPAPDQLPAASSP